MLNFQTARSALQAKDQILATYAMNELCDFCEKHIYNPWANRICFDRSVQDVNNSASMGCRTCAIFDAYLYPGLSSKRNDRTMARIALKVAPYDVTSFKNAGEEEPEEKPKADIELTFHLIPEKGKVECPGLIHDATHDSDVY